MARTLRAVVGGVVGLVAITGLPQSARAQALSLGVTVRVDNQAVIPNDLLAEATSRVAAIYANAGVDITFVNRGEGADFVIRLISREGEERMQPGHDAMGFAPYGATSRGRIAYVFQTRVDKVTTGYSAARYVVLAVAMAHEVGHLLLPPNAHSQTGIMKAMCGQAEFHQAALGQLLFTPEQIAQIHSRLTGEALRIVAR